MELAAGTVRLKLRWPDFTTLTRQVKLPAATDDDIQIFKTAMRLLGKVRPPGRAVRLIGVGVTSLTQPIRQLGLWDEDLNEVASQAAIDALRDKYGKA
jgi:DNA polymerase-4